MSVEHSASFGIGWLIEPSTVPAKMKKEVKEESHQEPRFDPKTGKPIEPETVIDQEEGTVYLLGESEFCEFDEFISCLAEKVGGYAGSFGDFVGGDVLYTIEVNIPDKLYAHATVDGKKYVQHDRLPVSSILELQPALARIQEALHQLGFDLGEPEIILQETTS
jgi:hypothetical protein